MRELVSRDKEGEARRRSGELLGREILREKKEEMLRDGSSLHDLLKSRFREELVGGEGGKGSEES